LKPYTPGTVVDGELVGLDSNGNPNFNALQNASADSHIVFYAFDVLAHGGENVPSMTSPTSADTVCTCTSLA